MQKKSDLGHTSGNAQEKHKMSKQKTLNDVQPITEEQVKLMFSVFGASVIDELEQNAELLDFLTFFPVFHVGSIDVNNDGNPTLQVFAQTSKVALYKGVSSGSLAQKADNDETLLPSATSDLKVYHAAALLKLADNIGTVNRNGKASFQRREIEKLYAEWSSMMGIDCKEAVELAKDTGTAAYEAHKAEQKANSTDEEG